MVVVEMFDVDFEWIPVFRNDGKTTRRQRGRTARYYATMMTNGRTLLFS
jgi:hypothetical protein